VKYLFAGFSTPFDKHVCVDFKPGASQAVRFRLTDANGVNVGTALATLTLAKLTNGVPGPEFDAVPEKGSGNAFVYDAKKGEYSFALKTKSLDKATYLLIIRTDDGEQQTVRISALKNGCP
jgi:hypothetical protein